MGPPLVRDSLATVLILEDLEDHSHQNSFLLSNQSIFAFQKEAVSQKEVIPKNGAVKMGKK